MQTVQHTTLVQLTLQKLGKGFRMLGLLAILMHYIAQLRQAPVEGGKVRLVVNGGLVHMVEDLLQARESAQRTNGLYRENKRVPAFLSGGHTLNSSVDGKSGRTRARRSMDVATDPHGGNLTICCGRVPSLSNSKVEEREETEDIS